MKDKTDMRYGALHNLARSLDLYHAEHMLDMIDQGQLEVNADEFRQLLRYCIHIFTDNRELALELLEEFLR